MNVSRTINSPTSKFLRIAPFESIFARWLFSKLIPCLTELFRETSAPDRFATYDSGLVRSPFYQFMDSMHTFYAFARRLDISLILNHEIVLEEERSFNNIENRKLPVLVGDECHYCNGLLIKDAFHDFFKMQKESNSIQAERDQLRSTP